MSVVVDNDVCSFALDQPVFPHEIFQLIIADLASDTARDRKRVSIKSCSLVCKAFLPLCRPFIFEGFTFGPVGVPNDNQHRLQILLNRQPHLSYYFQDITFLINHDQMAARHAVVLQTLAQQTQMLHNGPNPVEAYVDQILAGGDPSLVRTLTNLKTLRIEHIKGHAYIAPEHVQYDRWCEPSITRVLKAYATSQTLTSLHINDAGDVPMFVVMAIPNLRALYLNGCTCTTGNNTNPSPDSNSRSTPPIEVNHHTPRLETLELYHVTAFPLLILLYCPVLRSVRVTHGTFDNGDPDFVERSHRRSSFDTLRYLYIDIDNLMSCAPLFPMPDNLGDIIAFPTLRNLCMTLRFRDDILAANTIFNHTRGLRSLYIYAYIDDGTTSEFSTATYNPTTDLLALYKSFENCNSTLTCITLDWILEEMYDESQVQLLCDALDSVRARNVISTIKVELEFQWSEFHLTSTGHQKPPFQHWSRLSHLLTQNTKHDFPKLSRVSISIYHNFPGENSSGEDWFKDDFLREPFSALLDCNNTFPIDFTLRHLEQR